MCFVAFYISLPPFGGKEKKKLNFDSMFITFYVVNKVIDDKHEI